MHCGEQMHALAEMDEEEDDIRYAWEYAVQHGQLELLEIAVEGLYRYYSLSARYEHGATLFRYAEQYLTEQGILPVNLGLWSRLTVCQAELMLNQGEQLQAIELIKPVVPTLEANSPQSESDIAFACVVTTFVTRNADHPLALNMGQRGLALYQALAQPWYISWALFALSCVYDSIGNIKMYRILAKQALVTQQSLGDPNLEKRIRNSLEFSALLAGEYQGTGQSITEFVDYLLRLGEPHLDIFAHQLQGIYFYHVGRFEEAKIKINYALSKGQAIGHLALYEHDLFLLSSLDSLTGHYASALERADTLIAHNPINHMIGPIIACTKIAQGEFDQAEYILQRALEIFATIQRKNILGMTLSLAGYLAYRRGNLQAAYTYLRDAFKEILADEFYFEYIVILGVLAWIYADLGEVEQAIELNALAVKHPVISNSVWWEDFVGKRITEIAAGLSTAKVEAAKLRGNQKKLFSVVAQYFEHFKDAPDLLSALLARPALQVLRM